MRPMNTINRLAGFARQWLTGLLLLCFMALGLNAHAQKVEVPKLTQRVTDQTGTLSASVQTQMTQELEALEKRKGAQIVVLMVPTTGEDTIESYARRVFDLWRVGRAQVDDVYRDPHPHPRTAGG